MTAHSLGGLTHLGLTQNTGASSSLIIDAAGEKVAFCFRAPKTGSIDRLSFRVGSVTSSQTLRIGLETLDSSGDPTGTQYGGSAVGTQASPAASTLYEVTLATPASATIGDPIAAVIQFDSTVGNLVIQCGANASWLLNNAYPGHYTGTWAKPGRCPLLSVRYDDGTYHDIGGLPACAFGSTANNSSSTPDEYGNVWNLNYPVEIRGLWAFVDSDNAGDLVLYNSAGTALETLSVAATPRQTTSLNAILFPCSPRELPAGTYRIVLKPTTTSSCSLNYLDVLSLAHLDGMQGGQTMYSTTRTDGGAWTDLNTRRYQIGPSISGIIVPPSPTRVIQGLGTY